MKHSKLWPVTLLGVIGLLVISLTPQVTFAHPLDQFILASYLTVTPQAITVEVDMTPGVLLAPQFIPTLDTNNDQQVSDAEGQIFAQTILKQLDLKVDGKTQQLSFTKIDMPPYLNLQTGYGEMRLYAQATLTGEVSTVGVTHQISYRNNYQPTNPAYQVNAFLDDSVPVTNGPQHRDSIQQSMTMDFTISAAGAGANVGASTPHTTPAPAPAVTTTVAATNPGSNSSAIAAAQAAAQAATGNSDQLQQVLNSLYQSDLSPWLLLAALGLALLLGGLHALTPGHGKTMVAAYLVGSRGTAKHAIALGGIVTFTHTFSVILLGLGALLASQFIVPAVLIPVLETIAGLLVIGMGTRLIMSRWRWAKGRGATGVDHSHSHDEAHSHSHSDAVSDGHSHSQDGMHSHSHDHAHSSGHSHTHGPLPEKIRASDLIAMGVSGGLVPCPEALGILVVAVGLNRIGFGLSLIVAFSLGVAAVLISIGLLLVKARTLLDRFTSRGKSWQRWLPLVSAGIVTIIGVAMVINGLKNYPMVLAVAALVVVIGAGGIWLCLRLLSSPSTQPVPATLYRSGVSQVTSKTSGENHS